MRNQHPTKKGPGRRHKQGQDHGAAARPTGGHFLGQHTNPAANARRAVKATIGARQYRKQRKALALAARQMDGVAQ